MGLDVASPLVAAQSGFRLAGWPLFECAETHGSNRPGDRLDHSGQKAVSRENNRAAPLPEGRSVLLGSVALRGGGGSQPFKPLVLPLQASPGFGNSSAIPAATSCPYDCVRVSSSPGSGMPFASRCRWFSPEKAQIEFALSGAAVGVGFELAGTPVGEPGPLISPAKAEPAPRAATATAHTAAARNDLVRMFLSPFTQTPLLASDTTRYYRGGALDKKRKRPPLGRRSPDLVAV